MSIAPLDGQFASTATAILGRDTEKVLPPFRLDRPDANTLDPARTRYIRRFAGQRGESGLRDAF